MRELFPGTLVQQANGDPAPGLPFTVWTDMTSGDNVTSDLTTPDGASAYTATTDSAGLLLPFRGPDEVKGPLFADTGVGQRFMLLSSTAQAALFAAVAALQQAGVGGGSSGGGLPAGTTLEEIPNGVTRLAMTLAERTRIAGLPTTFLKVGTAATDAKRGDYAPTAQGLGAVVSMSGDVRLWTKRTTTQGPPTVAEGAVKGTDYAFLDVV